MRSKAEKLEIFRSADIYPVISSEFCLGRSPEDIFAAAAEGGAKIIQLREKNKSDKYLYELACKCRPIADKFGVLMMIDDRVDVALAARADGVHLGQDDMPVAVAKKIAPELFIGNSTHNLPEAFSALISEYEKVIVIDLSKIVPTVACPHLPENTHPASELSDIKIDQVVIGSCTNGRMEDMETAYRILNGKKVADGVRCIIIPGTMQILRECVEKGYYTAFIDAGAVVSTPTCGPCLGGYMGILAAGERCIATTNRNFVGRMGHTESEVYLASPATAAASALTGYITHPKEV